MIPLSPEEAAALAAVLDDYLPSLRVEIHRTEAHAYRENLERREALLSALHERLSTAAREAEAEPGH